MLSDTPVRAAPPVFAVLSVVIGLAASLAAVPDPGAVDAADAVVASDARAARASGSDVRTVRARPVGPVAAVEAAAVAAAQAEDGVPLADGTTCAAADLRVSYDDPGGGWVSGAWVGTLGPAPSAGTTVVNGILRCAGSRYAFVGFEAVRAGREWIIGLVPDPHRDGGEEDAGEHGHEHAHEHTGNESDPDAPEQPAPAEPAPAVAAGGLGGQATGAAIEGYARYEPQTTCSSTAQVGSVALRDLLLRTYPGTRSLGIVRGCAVGGRSEHKEGRAFDWGVLASRPTEKAAADDFVGRLLATDAYGNRHALARRMGVMYVIWDRRIWSAYNANAGLRAYNGSSPHTDHVHISLSWAGARGQTSFWTGEVVEGFPATPIGGGGWTSTAPAPAAPVDGGGDGSHPERDERWRDERRREDGDADDRSYDEPLGGADVDAERATTVARRHREEAERAAREQAKAEEHAQREREKAQREAQRREEKAQREAERAARRAAEETVVATATTVDPPRSERGKGKEKGKGKGKKSD